MQSKNRFFSSLRFYAQFIPLRKNGVVFFISAYLFIVFIRNEYYGEESQFTPFLDVFGWLVGLFAGAIVSLGLLYTLFCWMYLVLHSKRVKINLSIGLEDGQKGVAGQVPIKLRFSKVIMPVAGYLKTWLLFKDGEIVGPVVINKFSGGWRDLLSKEGKTTLQLAKRAQYHVQGYILSFEDYLQFFRFSFFITAKKTFYLYSEKREVPSVNIPPSKAQEDLEKVKTSKKVEGDFLNYKDFESGDDVRRIVWKIFAKNKDLVVRIPEIINPYASHLHFFASFQNSFFAQRSAYASGMLDYYKDIIFNTCMEIEKSGRKVEFSMDQVVGDSLILDKKDQLGYFLSCAEWRSGSLSEQFPTITTSSVVCVSSLIPAEELEELSNKRAAVLFIVQVSKYLDEQNLFNWSNVVFQKEEKSEVGKLKWILSSQRKKLKKNEEEIAKLVEHESFQGQLI